MSRLRPKIGTAKLTDKEKEKYFIGLYVKEGAIDEKIPYAEQRASLEPGAGHRILRRKRVQEEIKARTEPVRFEQMRQCVLGEAIVHAKAALQEELVKTAATINEVNITRDVLQGQLMQIVVGLDLDKRPKIMLDAIRTALVVTGTLEIKSTGWLSRKTSALLSQT